jgi:hypothetical protein
MAKFNLVTLTESMNNWSDGKLDEKTFADFFQFVWNKWNAKADKTELDLTFEFAQFSKVGA